MKTYGRVETQLHVFLTSAVGGGEWLASRSCSFTPGERVSDTRWIGGCVGPRVGLDAVAKIKIPFIVSSGNGTPVVQPVTLSLY
jgi:hypothetical protein